MASKFYCYDFSCYLGLQKAVYSSLGTRDWKLGTEKEDKEDNNNSCTDAINRSCTDAINRVSTLNSALSTPNSARAKRPATANKRQHRK
ncbi:hypothetical protein [Nostoc sp. DSM 114167]|jgi:hypothetical protein|uniref:hypothetical protein n=1 Tax=Nostoc sp. DSM 114167 TaxID=3439050 RepID=UPI0040463042